MKIALFILILSTVSLAAPDKVRTDQAEYERRIGAVVRNKSHFKQGKVEVQLTGGMFPYDSIVPSFQGGGRFVWHLSDHLAWEIIDAQAFFPRTGGFTKGLIDAQGPSHGNNFSIEAPRLKLAAFSNVVLTPFYGKIHVAGSWAMYFDFFLTAGVGAAKVENMRFSYAGAGSLTETILRSNWDVAFNVGVGFKIFMTSGLGLTLELRDYMVNTPVYGNNKLKSFFSTLVGLTFFLPSFG